MNKWNKTLLIMFLILSCKTQLDINTREDGMMNINLNAPVIGRNEIVIGVPKEKVLLILTDINNWTKWRKSITKSELLEPLAENSNFKWSSDGLNYKSRIHRYNKDAFGWTGKTIGAYAIHNWHFIEDNGKTLVKVEESLEGFFIKLMKKSMQKKMDNILITDLNELKMECEKK
jgi:hypothetical protein